jgi:predicted TIM-barrel fold metal-dependent hydrolase
VGDRKRVVAGPVLSQRDAAGTGVAQQSLQDRVDLGQDLGVIIDAHLHVDELPALGWSLEAAHCVRRLDEAGIDRGVVMTIVDAPEVNPRALELIAEACAAYPDRLDAFARIHPWYGEESLNLLERALGELGFKGLKLHPVSTIAHPAGEDSLRLIRRAAEHSAPTLFHCGDEPLTTPLAIAQAAAACPEATIILGHMGGYFHVDEAIDAAERFPNLVLETSAMPYPEKIRDAVERLGPERVLYASDGPACSPLIELEKVRLAGLHANAERLVLGGNAERILAAVS